MTTYRSMISNGAAYSRVGDGGTSSPRSGITDMFREDSVMHAAVAGSSSYADAAEISTTSDCSSGDGRRDLVFNASLLTSGLINEDDDQ